MSASAAFAQKKQINLFNASLVPSKEVFTANRIVIGVVAALLTMVAIGWWAVSERQKLAQELAKQTAARAAEATRTQLAVGVDAPLTPQELASREQALKTQVATVAARKVVRDALKRGLATDKQGPSALLRTLANTAPADAWVTELRAEGSQFELIGRTLDPTAVSLWQERLTAAGALAPTPMPVVKVERAEAVLPTSTGATAIAASPRGPGVYTFSIIGALAAPFAGERGKP
jgi:Tfp pilus assembly protein PilN